VIDIVNVLYCKSILGLCRRWNHDYCIVLLWHIQGCSSAIHRARNYLPEAFEEIQNEAADHSVTDHRGRLSLEGVTVLARRWVCDWSMSFPFRRIPSKRLNCLVLPMIKGCLIAK